MLQFATAEALSSMLIIRRLPLAPANSQIISILHLWVKRQQSYKFGNRMS